MKLEPVAVVAGLVGFFLGGYAVFVATDAQRTADDFAGGVLAGDEQLGDAVQRISALENAVKAQNERIKSVRQDEQQLRAFTRDLLARLEVLETWSRRIEDEGLSGGDAVPAIGEPQTIDDDRVERFEALREKVWSGTATDDEQADFWALARTTGLLDGVIEGFEARVDEAPRDIERKMQLADAYTAKLLTVPDGPERGAWAGKAETQWQDVLTQDDRHWQARFNLAFSWSQWPPFTNKAPAAIEQFEKLREQQESGPSDPRHVQVYLSLADLYRGQGNTARATEVVRAGLQRHPDSDALTKALDAATR